MYELIVEWYKAKVMFHACWNNWDTEDFYEALEVIKKYEQKIKCKCSGANQIIDCPSKEHCYWNKKK